MKKVDDVSDNCSVCKRYKKNNSRPVVGFSIARKFNEVLAMDIGEIEGRKFLVMMDHFSWYTQAIWIGSKKPGEIIKGTIEVWGVQGMRNEGERLVEVYPKMELLTGNTNFRKKEIHDYTRLGKFQEINYSCK